MRIAGAVVDLSIGSLFTGIAGIDLGLAWAGLGPVQWMVEKDDLCRVVLARHFPRVPLHEDVRRVGAHNLSRVGILCGGFPCQDVSDSGKRVGLSGSRSGLYFEFARIISELEPRFAVVENVGRGARERWLPTVRRDLHLRGYDSTAYEISAADCGAPHGRERIFVLAHRRHDGRAELGAAHDDDRRDAPGNVAHGCDPIMGFPRGPLGWEVGAAPDDQPALCRSDDGFSSGVDEADRSRRLHMLGNAAMPQAARVIGEIIRSIVGA